MMDELVKSITEAEEKAAELKAEANKKAAEILAEAERQAGEQENSSLSACRKYREMQLEKAQKETEAAYNAEIERKTKEAEAMFERLAKDVKDPADEIVRRICDGDM